MPKLKKLVQQKLLENEFENKPKTRDGVQAPYQPLLDEIEYINKRMKSCNFQGDQLEGKLRYLQKNYYDDMKIIDDDYKPYDGELFPWRSLDPHTANKYVYWDVTTKHMNLTGTAIQDVVIRKDGYKKQIKVLDTICRRLMSLDELFFKLHTRKNQLAKDLRSFYGVDLRNAGIHVFDHDQVHDK